MSRNRLWSRFKAWARRYNLRRRATQGLIVVSLISGFVTFLTMTGASSQLVPRPQLVVNLLYLDVVLLLLLAVALSRPLAKMWVARRQGLAGSRLHIKLVGMFSLVAVLPAIVVAVFSGVFLNFGIQAWFSERVATMLDQSRSAAHAYLVEHLKVIQTELVVIGDNFNREAPRLMNDRALLRSYMEVQARLHNMTELAIVDGTGRVAEKTRFSITLDFDRIPVSAIELADSGRVALLPRENDDRVRALLRLDRFIDTYLLVGRYVDSQVVGFIKQSESAYRDYKYLEENRKALQITFIALFVVLALLLLLASIGVGLALASSLIRPIGDLIAAAERIRKGDLAARAGLSSGMGEMRTLGYTFNRMAERLESQQTGLLRVNQELDERRRFTEAVLFGVSAGVIGLDAEGRINLPNRSAGRLLGRTLAEHRGDSLVALVPEFADLLEQARRRRDRYVQGEVHLERDGRQRTLLVRIGLEEKGGKTPGYVVTFDDITDLQIAQRQAAWADVARRIAHEIKNPLTPIRLSAERLKRKYLTHIEEDRKTFAQCTDTIVRQVTDIGRMVDEFSSFARMPEPILKEEDLCDICREVVALERNRSPNLSFDLRLPEHPVCFRCDIRQIGQALANLIKNAVESITEHTRSQPPGVVTLRVEDLRTEAEGPRVVLRVEDNGPGFPDEKRARLTEPYVTTRAKGTGLGLAIVRKIMEDHDGEVLLEDLAGGGARVSLVFFMPAMERQMVDEAHPSEETMTTRLARNGA